MKYLDRIANIAVIVGVIVFLAIVARGEFGKRQQADISSKSIIGKTISIPGVHFQRNSSLVLVISTTCHFCKESMPFYKTLATKSQGKVNFVAVLPQSQAESEAFLQNGGVSVTQIVSAKLDSIGVSGTPTLLLVDSAGKVQDSWIGELDQKGQQDVLSHLAP